MRANFTRIYKMKVKDAIMLVVPRQKLHYLSSMQRQDGRNGLDIILDAGGKMHHLTRWAVGVGVGGRFARRRLLAACSAGKHADHMMEEAHKFV
jgi:hypothetical protein